MSNFKAKMHQIRFRLGLPRPRWGSWMPSPSSHFCFKIWYLLFIKM